jgi:hypothetical protein
MFSKHWLTADTHSYVDKGLTFCNTFSPTSAPSSPAIPLLPGGPTLENNVAARPIDDILSDIMKYNLSEESWPFAGEKLEVRQWLQGTQPDTGINVWQIMYLVRLVAQSNIFNTIR